MRVFRSFEEAKGIKNPVVTTGSFDGVHIGHKTILDRLNMLADKHQGESVLVTFDPHPRKVLYPETAGRDLKLINSREEKLFLLEKKGLDNVIIIRFTLEFSRITSEEFVRDILTGCLHAKVIVAGFNHHFGFNQEGDYKHLWDWQEKYGFEAEEIPEQEVHHETVSSTRIRRAIGEGYIQRANAYLDHLYIIRGKVTEQSHTGAPALTQLVRIGINDETKLLPPAGVYAVSVESDQFRSKGMVIIQRNQPEPVVLLDIFDDQNFNEKTILTLGFQKKILGMIDFSDVKSQSRLKYAKDEIADLIY